jgi:GDPmannose 4,6-dehydratase
MWCKKHNVKPSALVPDNVDVYVSGHTNTSFPKLRLGNLEALRDWGHAADYVRSMHLMLQQYEPDDYVVATGVAHSVAEFCAEAFQCIGIDNWRDFVVVDPRFFRPAEVPYLQGDATRARDILGWEPQVTFKELVLDMFTSDFFIAGAKA